jgi:hypothetical protein
MADSNILDDKEDDLTSCMIQFFSDIRDIPDDNIKAKVSNGFLKIMGVYAKELLYERNENINHAKEKPLRNPS